MHRKNHIKIYQTTTISLLNFFFKLTKNNFFLVKRRNSCNCIYDYIVTRSSEYIRHIHSLMYVCYYIIYFTSIITTMIFLFHKPISITQKLMLQ